MLLGCATAAAVRIRKQQAMLAILPPNLSSATLTPQSINVLGSIEWLVGRLDANPCGSESFLQRSLEAIHILALYQEFFPLEWQESKTSAFGQSHECPLYSEREVEFFKLVDEQVVPICLDWLFDVGCEERMPFIPLYPADDWDYYQDHDLSQFSHAIQLGLALNRDDGGHTFWWYCQHRTLSPEIPDPIEGKLDWELFKEVTAVGDTPLKHLPLAVEITCYGTGNVLLDFHPEYDYTDALWNADNLRWLASENQAAQVIHSQVAELSAWLNEGGLSEQEIKIERAVLLWNLAHVDSRLEKLSKEAVRKMALTEAMRIHRNFALNYDVENQLCLFDAGS